MSYKYYQNYEYEVSNSDLDTELTETRIKPWAITIFNLYK